MTIKCCKDCVPPKRHRTCHESCKEYKEEREQLDKENELIRQLKNPDMTGYEQRKIEKFNRYRNKKRH